MLLRIIAISGSSFTGKTYANQGKHSLLIVNHVELFYSGLPRATLNSKGVNMVEVVLKMPKEWEFRLRQLAEAGEYDSLNIMLLEVIRREFPMPEVSGRL